MTLRFSDGSSRPNLEYFGHAAAIAGPMILVLAGQLFLAGYTKHSAYLKQFGLEGAFAERPIYETMVEGYPAALIGTLICAVIATAGLLLIYLRKRYFSRSLSPDVEIRHQKRRESAMRVDVALTSFIAVVVTLFSGFVAGGFFGENYAWNVANRVGGGCKAGCAYITAKSKQYEGYIIEQDRDRVGILTRQGVYLIDAKSVTIVKYRDTLPFGVLDW